jgi:hypothetical protein
MLRRRQASLAGPKYVRWRSRAVRMSLRSTLPSMTQFL